jgi:hypothetical protein
MPAYGCIQSMPPSYADACFLRSAPAVSRLMRSASLLVQNPGPPRALPQAAQNPGFLNIRWIAGLHAQVPENLHGVMADQHLASNLDDLPARLVEHRFLSSAQGCSISPCLRRVTHRKLLRGVHTSCWHDTKLKYAR